MRTSNLAQLQQVDDLSQNFDEQLQFDGQEEESQVNFYDLCV